MNPRPFAWTVGIILVLLGVAGFVPPLASAEDDPLRQLAGVGGPQILGLLPTSPVLNIIHLTLGLWGVMAGRRLSGALLYCRHAAIVLAILFVFGLIPGPDNLFGLAPLYGNNLLLHGALALLCGLFGWLYRRPVAVSATDPMIGPGA
jgi:hypothetical protein